MSYAILHAIILLCSMDGSTANCRKEYVSCMKQKESFVYVTTKTEETFFSECIYEIVNGIDE